MQNFLTTSRVAKILNVSEAAVRQMENRGVLQADRTESGTRLFRQDDVDRVAAARRQRTSGVEAA
jgi:excisionase family DNA binding protein